MGLRVIVESWDEEKQEFVVKPLDDAPPEFIELVRQARGQTLSSSQIKAMICNILESYGY